MFQLTFENQVFSSLSDFELVSGGFPPYAQAALDFCKAWLAGQDQFVQHTSGSTGIPKPIGISRKQMAASAQATGAFFRAQSKTHLLCCLNPEYIAGKMMLVRAMVWDCPVDLVEPSANPFEMRNTAPDFIALVPMQAEAILEDPHSLALLKKIKHVIIGGAPVSESLKKSLMDHGISAWQTYGMTETVSHIALAKIQVGQLEYHTLPDVKIGQDERGALWVLSPMSGPEKIQTNDLIEMKSESLFSWLGRADFVINSGGIKLFPELLEQRAEPIIGRLLPGLRFFFFGEKDQKLGERLILIVESKLNPQLESDLLRELSTVLTKFELPKAIYFNPKFIFTPTGKINRQRSLPNQ
jgi:O-succinylbenzoic acid--CoA ligase